MERTLDTIARFVSMNNGYIIGRNTVNNFSTNFVNGRKKLVP